MAPAAAAVAAVNYDSARVHPDAPAVDAGDGHRVRGSRTVPIFGRMVAAPWPAVERRTLGPDGRGSSVHGTVQGGHRRGLARVQGPVDGYHTADRQIRGVQRRRLLRGRCNNVQHHIRHHTHVQAARADSRPH